MAETSDHPPPNSLRDMQQLRASIAALIARLLSHYWTADDPPELRRAQAEDWIGDLSEFGAGIVARACAEWRRAQSKRPTIADIRKLCIEDTGLHRPSIDYTALSGPNARDDYARSVGFSSWLERQDAIAATERRYEDARRHRENFAEMLGYSGGFRQMMRIGLVNAVRNAPRYRSQTAGSTVARKFDPTPEEMAASRRQLGIDPPTADGAAA